MGTESHHHGLNRGLSRRQRRRCGVMLLEVVISLSLLLVAMGVIGLTFRNGQFMVQRAEQMTRARLMTERLVAELDTNLLDMTEREQSGFFREGESIAGMSWRVEINPSDRIKGLLDIDVDIFMGDPEGSDDEHQLILSTRIQRAEPRGIDFEKDFGLDQDQISELTDAIPGGAQLFDPTNFDPRSLASLDLDALVELLPTIIQAFGGNIAQGQLDQIIQAAQTGDVSSLQNLAGQQSGQFRGTGAGQRAGTGNNAASSGGGSGRNTGQRGGQRGSQGGGRSSRRGGGR